MGGGIGWIQEAVSEFSGGSVVEEPATMQEPGGFIPRSEDPWKRRPTPMPALGIQGQRGAGGPQSRGSRSPGVTEIGCGS